MITFQDKIQHSHDEFCRRPTVPHINLICISIRRAEKKEEKKHGQKQPETILRFLDYFTDRKFYHLLSSKSDKLAENT